MHLFKRFRSPAAAFVVAAVLTPLLSGCHQAEAQGKAGAAPPPPTVTVAQPLVRLSPEWSEHPGRFLATRSVEVRPRISGYLQAVHFTDGQFVTKGQLLFTIDPLPFRARADKTAAELAQAQALLERTSADLKRAETLRTADAISQEELESRRAAFAQAQAASQAARAGLRSDTLDLGYTRVTAPISGRISDRRLDAGNLVQNGQTVLTHIVAVDPIYFEFSAPEGLIGGQGGPALKSAREVQVQLEGEGAYTHLGRLDFIDNAVDTASGTIRGRAILANPAGALTPGQFGRVRVLGGTPQRVVLAPEAAIGSDQSRKFVLVVGPQNKVEYRGVELGPRIDGLRVVKTGLTGSERIVIDGVQRAQPGQPVTPVAGKIAAVAPPAQG